MWWQLKQKFNKSLNGQAMIITTIMIGGLFLTATAIAGLLMFYQLQQAVDFGNSTIAIFAADAALEKAIYSYFNDPSITCPESNPNDYCIFNLSGPNFTNKASSSVVLRIVKADKTVITATGFDAGKRTVRLLQTTFVITSQ